MFQLTLHKDRLQGITEDQWVYIEKLIAKPNSIQIFDHDGEAGITDTIMMALALVLQEEGFGILRWHVYHICQKDPVEIREFEDGFAPKVCPICNEKLDEEVTTFNLELITKYPLKVE